MTGKSDYRSSKELKQQSINAMAGRYGGAVMMTLSYMIWIYLISYSGSIFTTMISRLPIFSGVQISIAADMVYALISTLIISFLNILSGMFTFGIDLYYLNISTGRDAQPADIFAGFRGEASKVFKISAFLLFPTIILSIPFNMFSEMYMITSDSRYITIACAFLIPSIAIGFYMHLTYGMAYFLLLDFPKLTASRILHLTRKKMYGHRARLLALDLRFIPMILLGVLSMGIGMLWVYPIVSESQALFFLNLMNPGHYIPIDERI
ncbi:MAG: DUF975 family protein [Lachnospiraceae bacterium]|nr:DUF975 family protein [Lachnospiraceae bacterium]